MITYPLNNILYSAEDAELFHCTRTSGVFSADDEFAASVTGADNTVTIGPGIAWIRNARFSGKVAANKTAVSLDMGLADGSYPRIDAVVIQFDANANQTAIVVKQGVAASSPVPPEVVRTEAVYELHLYHVRRAAGAAVVSATDISDMRQDRNYCGVMMDDVTNIDENKFLSKTAYDPSGAVEEAGGIAKYVATNAPKTTVVNSVTSNSTTEAAAAAAVKKAYDQAVAAKKAIPALSSSVSSDSTTTAATSNAVKQAYDEAKKSNEILTGNGLFTHAAPFSSSIDSIISQSVSYTKRNGVLYVSLSLTANKKANTGTSINLILQDLPIQVGNVLVVTNNYLAVASGSVDATCKPRIVKYSGRDPVVEIDFRTASALNDPGELKYEASMIIYTG